MNRGVWWLLGLAAIAAAGLGGYYFLFGQKGAEISLEFVKPREIFVGQPFNLSVSFSNYSDRVLGDVNLSLILPEGLAFMGQPKDRRVSEKLVGDLGPGSLGQESFDLIALDGADSLKRIEAKLTYKLGGGSGAVFESSAKTDLALGRPAADMSFSVPERVLSGEDFEISLTYRNNTREDLKNLELKIDYPPVFQYKNSSVEPQSGKNVWAINNLARGEEGVLVISGNAVGPANSLFAFKAEIAANVRGERYTLASQTAGLSISSSPLSLEAEVNNSPNYLSRPGDGLNYSFVYRNNSNVAMENVNIRAVMTGEMFDFATVRTNAAFNSLNNTFTWNAANTPELANVPPGGEGKVEVYLQTKNSYPIRRLSDKNFTLKVHVEIESRTVPPGTIAERTISVARLETKVAGRLDVDALGYWRDADSGIVNGGTYPPRVNRPTSYTIHWLIRNYASDAAGVRVSAFLQSGSRFTGVVKSNAASVPVYNPASGEVVWDIGNVPANKGVVDAPLTAIFQVENTPAVNQIGQNVVLIGETRVTGQDSFAGVELADTDPAIATDLPDDKTIGQSDRAVQP
jgi:hypothetical protein